MTKTMKGLTHLLISSDSIQSSVRVMNQNLNLIYRGVQPSITCYKHFSVTTLKDGVNALMSHSDSGDTGVSKNIKTVGNNWNKSYT